MMISPVSSVRFCGNADDMLSRPGAYSKPAAESVSDTTTATSAKKSKLRKTIVGTLLAAAALIGGAVALRHFAPDTFKILENTKDAKFLDKAKHYVAKTGQYVIDKCSEFGKWVKNLLPKKSTPEA